jgi:Tetratricopeptide repeat
MRRLPRALLLPCELGMISLLPLVAIEQALTKVSAPALLAQESPAKQPALPPEAQKLRAAALSAYQTGEKKQAVKLQQQLLSWMNVNLPAAHPLRAAALQNMGVYLRGTGQRTEALPPSLEAVNIYRELAKSNKDFRPDLASSLNNLGVRLSELGQRAKAL